MINDHADYLGIESDYLHKFGGTELLPGDLLAFDYKNGEGIQIWWQKIQMKLSAGAGNHCNQQIISFEFVS